MQQTTKQSDPENACAQCGIYEDVGEAVELTRVENGYHRGLYLCPNCLRRG